MNFCSQFTLILNKPTLFHSFRTYGKRLSEVGFEPTPTFVDQNAPVRKSFTLESGALDRSAILTCLLGKEFKYLNARKAKFLFS